MHHQPILLTMQHLNHQQILLTLPILLTMQHLHHQPILLTLPILFTLQILLTLQQWHKHKTTQAHQLLTLAPQTPSLCRNIQTNKVKIKWFGYISQCHCSEFYFVFIVLILVIHDIWEGKKPNVLWSKMGPYKLFSKNLMGLAPGKWLESEVGLHYQIVYGYLCFGSLFYFDSFCK